MSRRLVRRLVRLLVREVANDHVFSKGLGALEKDRQDPWTTHQIDATTDEDDPTDKKGDRQHGRENRRTGFMGVGG